MTTTTGFELFAHSDVQAYLRRNARCTLAFSFGVDGLWYCDIMSGFAQTYEIVRSFEAPNMQALVDEIVRYCTRQLPATTADWLAGLAYAELERLKHTGLTDTTRVALDAELAKRDAARDTKTIAALAGLKPNAAELRAVEELKARRGKAKRSTKRSTKRRTAR